MNYKTIQKIIVSILVMMFIITISVNSFARPEPPTAVNDGGGGTLTTGGIKPSDITGADYSEEFDLEFIDKITDLVRTIGIFIAVGAMMIIGIRYVTGSIEEKANYKKSMLPYLIGCFVLFGASVLVPEIKDLFKDVGSDTSTEDIANSILSMIRATGTMVTVAVLMILGIKYMIGSTEEKATYKKSMLPYAIGVILIFAAVNLTSLVYDIATNGIEGRIEYNYSSGTTDADKFLEGKSGSEIYDEYLRAVEKMNEAKANDPDSKEVEYWRGYSNKLYDLIKDTYL